MQQEVVLNCQLKVDQVDRRWPESSRVERGVKSRVDRSSRSAIVLDRSCSSTPSISGSTCVIRQFSIGSMSRLLSRFSRNAIGLASESGALKIIVILLWLTSGTSMYHSFLAAAVSMLSKGFIRLLVVLLISGSGGRCSDDASDDVSATCCFELVFVGHCSTTRAV